MQVANAEKLKDILVVECDNKIASMHEVRTTDGHFPEDLNLDTIDSVPSCRGTELARYLVPHRLKSLLQRRINAFSCRRSIHLLHIGKTGGTAITHAIGSATKTPRALIIHPHEITIRDVPEGDGILFFVRDPLARFSSGYFSRRRQGYPAHKVPWSAEERLAFERFETPDSLAIALASEDPAERCAAEDAMCSIEHVRSSYWDWFIDEQHFRGRWADIVFIGQQEALNEDFVRLKPKLGLCADLTLPDDVALAHRSPPNENRELSVLAQKNLRCWYLREYEFLRLCARWRIDILATPFDFDYQLPDVMQENVV